MTPMAATEDQPFPAVSGRIRVVAHRGASGIVAEDNTRVSFQRAMDMGADFIETDLRKTRDGRILCFHDSTINGHPVESLDARVLRRESGIDVPSLSDLLALVADAISLDLEIKAPGFEAEILQATAEGCAAGRIVYKSFLPQVLQTMATLNPAAPVGLLIPKPEADSVERILGVARELNAHFISPHHTWVGTDLFERASDAGFPVWVWTVDDPRQMRELMARPISAIITNRPDYAVEQLRRPLRGRCAGEVRARFSRTLDPGGMASFMARSKVGGIPVPTRQIRVGRGVLEELPDWISACIGVNTSCAVVMDNRTRAAAGNRILELLPSARAVEIQPRFGAARVTPHEDIVHEVEARVDGCDFLISVGSGTINDMVKSVAHRTGRTYGCVPTAASMNGYTSSISALLVNNLKVTMPCGPPNFVLGDSYLLAGAPLEMGQSGYADLLGKTVSAADWKMASLLGFEQHSDVPGVLVDGAVERCIACAPEIGRGQIHAQEILLEALILSGFSMTLGGSSVPASGGEHLISHLWDMSAYAEGKLPGLHGFQVGLGTLMSAGIYEILGNSSPASFQSREADPNAQRQAHGALWRAIEPEAKKQRLNSGQARDRLALIQNLWPEIWTEIGGILKPFSAIREMLLHVGAPTTLAEMNISREQGRYALLHAADIRARYTVLHLARDVGLLESSAEEVLSKM